jgi:lactoylglutathione lyase
MNLQTNVKQAVTFFAVSNIDESIRYYVDGLGFQMTNKWMDGGKLRWCWLQHGGAALMLQ